jgi:hypothetical protein
MGLVGQACASTWDDKNNNEKNTAMARIISRLLLSFLHRLG